MFESIHDEAPGGGARLARLGAFADRFLPAHARELPATSRMRLRLLAGAFPFHGLTCGLTAALLYRYQGASFTTVLFIVLTALLLGGFATLRRARSEVAPATFFCACLLTVMVAGTFQRGTIGLGSGQWHAFIPLAAL